MDSKKKTINDQLLRSVNFRSLRYLATRLNVPSTHFKIFPILIFTGLIVFLFLSLGNSPSIYIDEFWIASIAHDSFWYDGIVNTSFRNYSHRYIDLQPLYTLSIGGMVELFGGSLFTIRFLSALSIMVSALFIYWFSTKGRQLSTWMILLPVIFIVAPITWRTAHICRPEPIVMCILLLILYFNFEVDGKSFGRNLLQGLAITLPVYFYITGILIFPLVAVIFVREFFIKPAMRKILIQNASFRLIGVIFGFLIFFDRVGSPIEIWRYLTESEVSKVNVSESGLFGRLFSFLRYYFNYQTENIIYYFPVWVLIIRHFVKKGITNREFLFFLFYFISVAFLTLLSRKSVNYLFYSETFLFLTAISVLVNESKIWRKTLVTYLLTTGVFFVLFYAYYFFDFKTDSINSNLKSKITSKGEIVLARMVYKGFFLDNPGFLALEEFEYLVRTGQTSDPKDYVKINNIEWAIIDDAALAKVEMVPLVAYIRSNFHSVDTFHDLYIGHRVYEDIPYDWNFPLIFKRITDRPASTIKIYKRVTM